MEAADDERTLRRARWFIRAFRLIFYPAAAIAAFLLLTAGGGGDNFESGPGRDELTEFRGRTAQEIEFLLWTYEGRPHRFRTEITATCPDGTPYTLTWYRVDKDRIAFDEDTGAVDAELAAKGRWSNGALMDYDAQLHGRLDGDTITGTLRLVDQGGGHVCDSGAVSFYARAGQR